MGKHLAVEGGIAPAPLPLRYDVLQRLSRQAFCLLVGRAIRETRRRRGMTIARLSYEADVNYDTIRRIERGTLAMRLLPFLRLAQALGVEPTALTPTLSGRAAPDIACGRSWAFTDHRSLAEVDALGACEKND